MTIKIKDMWVPGCCLRCPLNIITEYGERRCFVTGYLIESCDYIRHEDCPIEEIEEED